MSKQFKLPAQFRNDEGKGASRRLRRSGLVPAVVYGGDRDPVNISIEHDVFLHQAAEQAFHSSILELKVDDKKQKVVLRDLQRHPWQARIMQDRKSTRLNSSHVAISYAVFCLKKKHR